MCFCTLLSYEDFEEYFKILNTKQSIELGNLQNPFFNPTFEKIKEIKITAIMLDRVKINNKWYKKGDKIEEAVITDITTKEIILKYDTLDFKIAFKNNGKINIY
ncbi:transformation system protein [Campylobacter coli]|uniref:Transformation system protein n=1 Tax=Campylobacter jejuni TaxID=197 RepID=A0A6C7UMA9_CAMJU|nr:transformation system protein [Campylobacter coli]